MLQVEEMRYGILSVAAVEEEGRGEGATDSSVMAQEAAGSEEAADSSVMAQEAAGSEEAADSVMAQLQRIFGFLEGTDRQAHSPVGFCRAYKDFSGQPINVNIQQDAQEFFSQLVDKVTTREGNSTPQEGNNTPQRATPPQRATQPSAARSRWSRPLGPPGQHSSKYLGSTRGVLG